MRDARRRIRSSVSGFNSRLRIFHENTSLTKHSVLDITPTHPAESDENIECEG